MPLKTLEIKEHTPPLRAKLNNLLSKSGRNFPKERGKWSRTVYLRKAAPERKIYLKTYLALSQCVPPPGSEPPHPTANRDAAPQQGPWCSCWQLALSVLYLPPQPSATPMGRRVGAGVEGLGRRAVGHILRAEREAQRSVECGGSTAGWGAPPVSGKSH